MKQPKMTIAPRKHITTKNAISLSVKLASDMWIYWLCFGAGAAVSGPSEFEIDEFKAFWVLFIKV